MVTKKKFEADNLPKGRRKRYHKRSPWACDECRLRKKKCDGRKPCDPCKATENVCTYEIRRPAQAPTQRIRDLEQHVRYATSFLKDLDKKLPPTDGVDIGAALKILDFTAPAEKSPPPLKDVEPKSFKLASMVTGCDQIVRDGPWSMSFFGATSGFAFVMRTIELFQKPSSSPPLDARSVVANLFDAPLPSPEVLNLTDTQSVPVPEVAAALVESVFARCYPLMQFLERKDFQDMMTHIYDDLAQLGVSDRRSISLLHLVLALGYLFSVEFHQDHGCKAALKEATRHFLTGSDGLARFGTHDLLSLQMNLCAIQFLVSTCRLAKAHSLIGTACSSALRLGLHTATASVGLSANQIQARTKVFAALIKLDTYASLILGLPPFIHIDEIHPDVAKLFSYSDSAVDESTTLRSKAAAMHFDLLKLTVQSRDAIFPSQQDDEDDYIDPQNLTDVENRLQAWTKDVSPLLANGEDSPESTLIKHQLEMTYHFSQMLLFRPFLHYLRIMADGGQISYTESQHALACIKVASTTIVRSDTMISRGVWPPASWTSMYSLFLSVMCLTFLIAAHPGTTHPSEAWKKAVMGIRVLAAHRCVDDCASACLNVLRLVVQQLSHTLDFDFDQIEASTPCLCSRHRQSVGSLDAMDSDSTNETKLSLAHILINQASMGQPDGITSPVWHSDADKILAQAEEMSLLYPSFDMFEDYVY